jgi:DNA repair exonuclease SbcCD ATPase subunit
MSSSVLEEEKAKFKAQKKQLKAEYATISEELREQKKSIAERRSLLEENKAKLKSRRQKLTEVLVSSSVLNPPSEEVREKNNITIKNYESKTQELVNYIEEEEREVIPIENDILEKSNDIEKKKNILLKVSEIFKKNKKYIMKLIKKFKKNFSVVSNDNIVELLQSIEQNRAVIYENLKKMGVIEKKLNLHTSGIYVYNLNNVSLENVSRNDILDTLIEISTKTKTRKAADVLLNKRLEKLKLVGGFISNASKGYTYDLEYIEDDSNGTYSINTYYSRMKKELKKNKVN